MGVTTGADIETYKVDDLRDVFNLQANVRAFQGNRGEAGFVIRGINSEGLTQPTNQAPVTSVIIDGAPGGTTSTWPIKT